MTGELSAAATTALSAAEQVRAVSAVGFLKARAQRAGVPHPTRWQLHHDPDRIFPWRVVDRGAPAGDSRSRNVAFTLHAGTAGTFVAELETLRPATARHPGAARPRLVHRPDGRIPPPASCQLTRPARPRPSRLLRPRPRPSRNLWTDKHPM